MVISGAYEDGVIKCRWVLSLVSCENVIEKNLKRIIL